MMVRRADAPSKRIRFFGFEGIATGHDEGRRRGIRDRNDVSRYNVVF